MIYDKCGHPLKSCWRSYQSFQWDADLISDLFSYSIRFSGLLQLCLCNCGPGVIYCQFDDARFVVQRFGGSVFYGLTNIVHICILTEDMNGVFVTTL